MKIHQPHGKTLGTKEALCTMKYQPDQIVRRSIRASVAWKEMLVISVAKKDTKLKNVQRKIEHKKLERQCQPQSSNLQPEGGIINHGKTEFLPLYQEISQLPLQ